MSEFDKEAEREKLRKKYEEDEADREVTQRMSELLLQGATMTNQHCDNCGSPIFRYEGQSFCPTCQAEGEPQAAAGQQPGGANQSAETTRNQVRADETGRESETSHQGDADDARTAPAQQPSVDQGATDQRATAGGRPAPQSGDLSDARDALVRKLTQLAQEAERTTDVNRTRDLLAASKEAAEALAALDRASGNDR